MWSLVEDSHAVARNLLFILSRRLRQGNALIGASLLEKVSDLELEEFQPQEVPESKGKLEEKSENETVRLYNAATAYVSESIRKAQKKKSPDRAQGEKLVKRMIDSIAESPALLLLAHRPDTGIRGESPLCECDPIGTPSGPDPGLRSTQSNQGGTCCTFARAWGGTASPSDFSTNPGR